MDEQTVLANLEHRLALELGRQHMMRMRAEVERDLAKQSLAQAAEGQQADAPATDGANKSA